MTLAVVGTVRTKFAERTHLMALAPSRAGRTQIALTGHVITNVAASAGTLTVLPIITSFARVLTSITDKSRLALALSRLSVAAAAIETIAGVLAVFSVVSLGATQLAQMPEISRFAVAMAGESVAHSAVVTLAGQRAIGAEFAEGTRLVASVAGPSHAAVTFAGRWMAVSVVFARTRFVAIHAVSILPANLTA